MDKCFIKNNSLYLCNRIVKWTIYKILFKINKKLGVGMKLRVAVCDDLKESLIQIKKLLEQIPYVHKIETFSDMNYFYEELKEGKVYDIVFMDIDWKQKKTGIDFAYELQKQSPYSQIIYITAYTMEYVEDVFLMSSNLSGFLTKPVKMEQLQKNLEKVRKRQQELDGKLLIRQKGAMIAIPFREILYLESQLHKVNIILHDCTYQCNEQLVQIKKRLNEQFLECHKSYLVNMEHIKEMRNGEILLNSGMTISISKTRASEAKKRFFEYMSGRM